MNKSIRLAVATTLTVHPAQKLQLCAIAKWCRAAVTMVHATIAPGVHAQALVLTDDAPFVAGCVTDDRTRYLSIRPLHC